MYLQGRTEQAGESFSDRTGGTGETGGKRKGGREISRPSISASHLRARYRALPKKARKYQVRFMMSVFSMASESAKL